MNCHNTRADACACILGGPDAPKLQGTVRFFQRKSGALVVADIRQLPPSPVGFFALHIHDGNGCGGEEFSQSGSHYNPKNTKHPAHDGDLPPLLSCHGSAYMAVMTDRFRVCDVIGKTVVIHSGVDDFTTQPAGNAGKKIACGVIAAV